MTLGVKFLFEAMKLEGKAVIASSFSLHSTFLCGDFLKVRQKFYKKQQKM